MHFFLLNEVFNITFRDFGKSCWMFFKLGTGFVPRSYFVSEISKEPAARLSGKLPCNWLLILVTMAKPVSSHVKDRNSIFTARDEDMMFYFFLKYLSGPESQILESDWLIPRAPAARIFPSRPRVRTASSFPGLRLFKQLFVTLKIYIKCKH